MIQGAGIHLTVRWITWIENGLFSALWLAFMANIAWRNRRNKFLMFGWLGVMVVFAMVYIFAVALSLSS